jgi:shikimate dehydrogenase
MARRFTFIGVTTAQSSIMQIFPRWRDVLELGADVEIVGWDLPIHAPPQCYRQAVTALRADPANLGGLITTHKIDLYQAASDLFDEIDTYARLLAELSCIAKRNGRLLGWAKDPISAGRALARMLGAGSFRRTGAQVLCFGAGGAGRAIILYLLTRPQADDRPSRIIVTDRDGSRLERLQTLRQQLNSDVAIECIQNVDPVVNNALVAGLPAGSLVINATGMGKDLPGSPVTDAVRFPEGGIAWDLNYRGELDFLRQAYASGTVRVEDGWQYFIFGWTTAIEEVFNRPISEDELQVLTQVAAFARPPRLNSKIEAS